MGAIGRHTTATDDGAWDGPGNVARLNNDGTAGYYRRMYAWVDPDGDPEAKSSYKFPNHFVSADGSIGAASTRACVAGIAVLNGGRGGSSIPAGDRRGVYNHLAGHLRDAGIDPPELRIMEEMERRVFRAEVRADAESGEISGYAAVFNEESEDLGGFREVIQPGAFRDVLGDDVRALFNHDANYVLGRNRANTLALAETKRGLEATIKPPDTQWARDLLTSMRRGDVDQMSFGFTVADDDWQKGDDGLVRRTVKKIGRLFDVSVVTYPAYPQTSAQARSMAEEISLPAEEAGQAAGESDDSTTERGPEGRTANLKRRVQIEKEKLV